MDSEYSTAPDIDVKPSGELCFKGLSSSIITAQMEVKNPHASPVYFHVKTTAPKRYCVAPNQGLILPNETCYVSVMLQPFEFDPENIVKAKIRVVAMFVPQGRKSDKEFLLTLQDKVAPELKMQTTLMCVYKPPDPGDISVQPVKCRVIGKRWDMNSILQVGVDPGQQLWFEGPFDKVVTVQMKLINPSSRKVYFKVKTTAPRCYCVKPNSGIIWPRATMFVSLMLQPFDYDPGRQVPRHKMMVVAMFVPVDGEEPDKDFLSSLLKNIPLEEKMEMRLVCVHKLPGHHLSDSVPSRSEDAETRHEEFSDITDITDSEFIGEVTESDCVGEITKKVDSVRIGPSDDDDIDIYDEFDIVLRCKTEHDSYITKVLKAEKGPEALKWRFVFKNKARCDSLSERLSVCGAKTVCTDVSDVVIETEQTIKYPDYQTIVKGCIVEETTDVRVGEIYIDVTEAKEVLKVVTSTCPPFATFEVLTFMEGKSGRTRFWLVTSDQLYETCFQAFRKAQDYVYHVLKQW